MEYLGAWGTLIHEKNLKSKISCQTPFKQRQHQCASISNLFMLRYISSVQLRNFSVSFYCKYVRLFQFDKQSLPNGNLETSNSYTDSAVISGQQMSFGWESQ